MSGGQYVDVWVTLPEREHERIRASFESWAESIRASILADGTGDECDELADLEISSEYPPGPSRAVVASIKGQNMILEWEGGDLVRLEYFDSMTLLDLDQPPDDGFWLWRGRIVGTKFWTDYGWEYDVEADGEWRKLSSEELEDHSGDGILESLAEVES